VDPVVPDLAGFTEAQRRLRGGFGETVTFYKAEVSSYPPGTPIDPETGEPYDPTVEPDSTTQDNAAVKATVAFRSLSDDQEDTSALGQVERTHVLVIADIADRPQIDGAIEFVWHADRYKVQAQKPDGIGGEQRFLTWGRLK
jgi:hypothetical protein